MSFALDVKEELTRVVIDSQREKYTVLEAILKTGVSISFGFPETKLIFNTRSNAVLRYILKLLSSFHNIKYNLYQKQIMRFNKPIIFYLEIIDESKLLIEEFSLLIENTARQKEILNDEVLKSVYLRGAFITKGSVNNPDTSRYHLEFSIDNQSEALFIQNILNSYNLNARISKRRDNLVVYVKDTNSICDILRIMGAIESSFKFEEKIITRSVVSDTRRKINIDIANQSKTNEAAKNEMRYIKYLEYYYPIETLDYKLLLLMKLRKENQEASLNELANLMFEKYGEKVSKSGISHRLKRIKDIALEFQKKRLENDRN